MVVPSPGPLSMLQVPPSARTRMRSVRALAEEDHRAELDHPRALADQLQPLDHPLELDPPLEGRGDQRLLLAGEAAQLDFGQRLADGRTAWPQLDGHRFAGEEAAEILGEPRIGHLDAFRAEPPRPGGPGHQLPERFGGGLAGARRSPRWCS